MIFNAVLASADSFRTKPNALFNATGVRFSKPPFTPEAVRETLKASLNHPMEAID